MCGIVGYVGSNEAASFLLEGLRRLEYRGYDSSGVVTSDNGELGVKKTAGRVEDLSRLLTQSPANGNVGVGHTRWATHGPATDENAHPHLGGDQVIALVHNGVIENYSTIKERLLDRGYTFQSATDSEVVAHLLAYELENVTEEASSSLDPFAPLVQAVQNALSQLQGTYGLAIVFRDWPDVIVAARLGSPLVIGVGDGENFIASDGSPLAGHTDKIVYLADHEIAVVTADTIRVIHRDQGRRATRREGARHRSGRHRTRRLRALHAQRNLRAARNRAERLAWPARPRRRHSRIRRLESHSATIAIGQTIRADRLRHELALGALVGEYMIEALARVPVDVEYASELRYRNPPIGPGTLLFALTQSGETIDTLAALREMKRKGHPTMSICNVVGSTIAREADGGIYLHAGPEIGVASTKAFTAQCVVMSLSGSLLRTAASPQLRSGHTSNRRSRKAARSGRDRARHA